jgi:hypothetical protein
MMFETFASVNGGWCPWDLLGPNFYKPWTHAMQWRGLLPYHYGDLSRQLGLPYVDLDFLAGSAMKFMPPDSPNLKEIKQPPEAAWTRAEILQVDGKSPFTSTDAPSVETP